MDDKRKHVQSYARKTLIDSAFLVLGGLLLGITKTYSWQLFVVYLVLYQITSFMVVRWLQKQKQRKQALQTGENNK